MEADTDRDDFVGSVNAKLFKKRNMTSEMVPRVAAKLNLDASVWKLEFDDIELLYTACVFSTTVLNTPESQSPCAVFEERDFELFAFWDDLEEYYESGPGTPVGRQMGCPLLKRMVSGLKDAAEGKTLVKSYLRFAHSETVMGLLSVLGLHTGGTPLTADMSWADAADREFRGCVISPMAANVDLVLYECDDGERLVELRHNERQVAWPRCGANHKADVIFCPLDDVIAAYPLATNCPFDTICENN